MNKRNKAYATCDRNERLSKNKFSPFRVCVDVSRQILEVWEDQKLIKSYPVSTSQYGTGFEEGSFKTPTGNFCVCEKIGDHAPIGAVFRARQQTGETASEANRNDDLILTRILRLDGCDAENANTRERMVYIHGTNREDLIGTPASHGCVRLKNYDMLDLYNRLPLHTPVAILPHASSV